MAKKRWFYIIKDGNKKDAICKGLLVSAYGEFLNQIFWNQDKPITIDLVDDHKNPATKDKERYPITQRLKIFGCSCCPPNILRFINAIGDFLYTEDGDTLYVHHFMNGNTEFEGKTIRQTTAYPACGKVKLETCGYTRLAVRVPGWCSEFEASAPY